MLKIQQFGFLVSSKLFSAWKSAHLAFYVGEKEVKGSVIDLKVLMGEGYETVSS